MRPPYPEMRRNSSVSERDHTTLPSIVAQQQALNTVDVEVTGLGVHCRTGPTYASEGDGGVKDVEPVVPLQFTGKGIVACGTLLSGDALADTADDADSAVLDDGGGASGEWNPPQLAVTVDAPAIDQPGLVRDPTLMRPTPAGPLRQDWRSHDDQDGDERPRVGDSVCLHVATSW